MAEAKGYGVHKERSSNGVQAPKKSWVEVADLEPGQIVAEPVYVNDKPTELLLLSEGITLTPNVIHYLKQRRIEAIHVVETGAKRSDDTTWQETRTEAVHTLTSFVIDLHTLDSVSLGPLNDMVDEIIDQLMSDSAMMVFLQRIFDHDNYVLTHSVDVAIYSTLIGLACGLTRDEITTMGTGALLHDIGKLDVSRRVLKKPATLTEDEYEGVKKHPQSGYKRLGRVRALDERARRISLEHHERMDGSGYPRGLQGKEAHMWSRITAVSDVYDALVTERTYRKAFRPDQAANILETTENLDKDLVTALLDRLVIYTPGTKVKLSDGSIGAVVKAPATSPRNPLVVLLISKDNENMLRRQRVEAVQSGKGISIADVVEDSAFEELLRNSR